MPSALRASRDFLTNAVARVRSGLSEYDRQTHQPGPEIKVEPFDAHNVSTPAALIKLGTSIAAARREKANYAAAQGDRELAREKARAEIAHLRAEAAYNLGEGRQAAGRAAPVILSQGPYAGMTAAEAATVLAEKRIDESRRAAGARTQTVGKVTAARAGLADIDKRISRDAELKAIQSMADTAPTFRAAEDPADPHNAFALKQLGFDPVSFNDIGITPPAQRAKMLADARQSIHDRWAARHRTAITNYYQPQREQYQAIIDEGAGLDTTGDQGAGGGTDVDALIRAIQEAGQE